MAGSAVEITDPKTPGSVLKINSDGSLNTATGGLATVAVAANTTTDTVIKASAGRLCKILVTATGTAGLSIFDNTSGHTGTIVGAVPANATVGTIYSLDMPCAAGITAQGAANTPGVTVSYV